MIRNHYAIFLWTAILILCAVIVLSGNQRTVSITYRIASQHWLQQQDIYEEAKQSGRGYLYAPQAAILYIPFAVLPFKISELCWRLVSIGLLVFSLWKMSLLHGEKHQASLFFLATVIAIPLGFSCFRNGQMTVILTALGLLSMLSVIKQQWNWAALCLILGFALKPLMIVLLLLVGATQKALRVRLAIGIVILGLLPFLTGNFHYALDQYISFSKTLTAVQNVGVEKMEEWTQFFGFLESALHVSVTPKIQFIIRAIAALATLGLSFIAVRQKGPVTSAMLVLALAVCYLVLFNPRTESNGYIILAPSLAYFMYAVFRLRRNIGLFAVMVGIILAFILSQTIWQQVLPAIVFSCLVIYWVFSIKNENRATVF